jgi:EAL domain-containing protein (putative c-di-GMP-specific phosphodiesterase class I)
MMDSLAPEPASRILLADDDENIRRDFKRMLTKLGFVVETAVDGQAAVELLTGSSFDVIISDLSMPRMGGLEFLRAVRRRDLDIPVVLMTGSPELETSLQAIEYGAFRYLRKPVDWSELGEVIRRAIGMHQMARLKREALGAIESEGRQLGDRASLEVRFGNAIEQLWMAYQPIVHPAEQTVFAYEALVRSNEPSLRGPLDLLDAAERLGRVHDLGRRIRREVTRSAPDAPDHVLLFVNLHATDLNDPELFSIDSPLTRIAQRVVLEITERASLHGVGDVAGKVKLLREFGYRIAVDDLGAGYAGLASFAQLEPEFVKLDMSLVRDVDTSARKRSVVRAMAQLCANDLEIQVICEGVETVAERVVLALEHCELLQGYLFAKPERGFVEPRW